MQPPDRLWVSQYAQDVLGRVVDKPGATISSIGRDMWERVPARVKCMLITNKVVNTIIVTFLGSLFVINSISFLLTSKRASFRQLVTKVLNIFSMMFPLSFLCSAAMRAGTIEVQSPTNSKVMVICGALAVQRWVMDFLQPPPKPSTAQPSEAKFPVMIDDKLDNMTEMISKQSVKIEHLSETIGRLSCSIQELLDDNRRLSYTSERMMALIGGREVSSGTSEPLAAIAIAPEVKNEHITVDNEGFAPITSIANVSQVTTGANTSSTPQPHGQLSDGSDNDNTDEEEPLENSRRKSVPLHRIRMDDEVHDERRKSAPPTGSRQDDERGTRHPGDTSLKPSLARRIPRSAALRGIERRRATETHSRELSCDATFD